MLPVDGIDDMLYSVITVSHISAQWRSYSFSQTPPKTLSRLITSTTQRVIWPANEDFIMLTSMAVAVQYK